jgi:hypothetical protein
LLTRKITSISRATPVAGERRGQKTGPISNARAAATDTIAAELTVPEPALLFCLASDTDCVKAAPRSIYGTMTLY